MNLLVDVELVVSVFCSLARKELKRLQDGTSSLLSVCCFEALNRKKRIYT
jgi:hypothetical protein